jgi:hypothetical protein
MSTPKTTVKSHDCATAKGIYAPAVRFTPMSYTNLIKVGG